MPPLYCQVALPVPLRHTFTYAVPARFGDTDLSGMRVTAPFRNRSLVGVVLGPGDPPPDSARIREITEILDSLPALTPELLALGRWVSQYYLAPIGETFRALLPPPVDVRAAREFVVTEAGAGWLRKQDSLPLDGSDARDDKRRAEDSLREFFAQQGDIALREIQLRKLPCGEEVVERLRREGILGSREITRQRKPRRQKIAAWRGGAVADSGASESRVREILSGPRGPLPWGQLQKLAKVSAAVLAKLEKQGCIATWEEPLTVVEDSWDGDYIAPQNALNPEQQEAVGQISEWLAQGCFTAGLLHGVTGSGKTEVYLAAIEAALAQERTAIVLVPEIALTLWMGRQARARFGPLVAVLHSALSDVERAREWWRLRRSEARVVVGTRSAVFAPLEKLGLLIVDEEQESSYKQEETPRYHGRDTAVYRASLEGAVALLGSATPSLESYHHARSGKYKLLQLCSRVENRPLAAVRIVDLREEFKRQGRGTPISEELRLALESCLAAGTQALVLINRRGYSWFLLCRSCGASLQCENCSIALTYHKRPPGLRCHYCGFARPVPSECPKCKSKYLYFVGDGTQRVEEYLCEQFPRARIARLDRDKVRTKREYQQVLGSFAAGELDILTGTQMLAKGHDFHRVTLVGVVAADAALSRPDFRAAERTFHLLTQVAGRAGRGDLRGEVLVETYYPEHYAIQEASRQDYTAFYEKEARFRRLLHYPPFTALASILVRDRKTENATRWSRALDGYFRPLENQGLKVLGPAAAPLAKLRREYRFQFLLKSAQRAVLSRALSGCLEFCASKEIPETAILVDVDPQSML